MVWESEALEDTATGLAALGAESVVFNPCGNRPEDGDVMTVMATNADALETIAEMMSNQAPSLSDRR